MNRYGDPRAVYVPAGALPLAAAKVATVALKGLATEAPTVLAAAALVHPKGRASKSLNLTADESPSPFVPFLQFPLAIRPAQTVATVAPNYLQPAFRTMDELLASCPTQYEIDAIRRDFNLSFDNGASEPWSCTQGGSESSVMLTVFNIFRAMRLVRFDTPIPVIGATNLYEWLYALQPRAIRFTRGRAFSEASAADQTLYIRSEILSAPAMRRWVDPSSGTGLLNAVTLVAHEARHMMGIPHNCAGPEGGTSNDSSLAYGGAWAAQYWLLRWFAEHAPRYFTPYEQQAAAWSADQTLNTNFCQAGG